MTLLVILTCLAANAYGGELGTDFDRETRILPGDGATHDMFGNSVALSGDTALIGALGDDDQGDYSGSAYIFVRGDSYPWVQQVKLLADDGAAQDRFGHSVVLSNEDVALVGAPRHGAMGTESGAVYIFSREGKRWNQIGKLLAEDAGAGDWFGYSLTLAGDTLLVGAPHHNTRRDGLDRDQSGAVYVFVRQTNGQWRQQARLIASDRYGYDRFGNSVALDGDTAVIGAYHDNDQGEDSGSVYVFVRRNGRWHQQAKLLAEDGEEGDWFGYRVAVSGETLAVGSYGNDDIKGSDAGAVHLFSRSGEVWQPTLKIVPQDVELGSVFGRSVVLRGDRLLVGAKYDNELVKVSSPGARPGLVYRYKRHGPGDWRLEGKLIATYGQLYGEMGNSIALDRGTVLTGAYHSNRKIESWGAAYVFEPENKR